VIPLVLSLVLGAEPPAAPRELRVGLVGLDTTHVVEFTALLNDPANPGHVPGARVVAGVTAGSPDVEASATRRDRFTAELRDRWKIQILASIEELTRRVDAVMITSVDGRTHLPQARQVLPAGKPTFVDKPMAASTADARAIVALARQSHAPLFSASSLRFVPAIRSLPSDPALGRMVGAFAWGPAELEPHHPDLFWYGVHAVEILYTLMGPGCVAVTRVKAPGADVVVGRWGDGRLGTMRGLRQGAHGYGAVAFGSQATVVREVKDADYRGLLLEVVEFFRSGRPPVPADVTVEMMAFMEAADLSRARAGAEVPLPAR
jgi:hypothetical protein